MAGLGLQPLFDALGPHGLLAAVGPFEIGGTRFGVERPMVLLAVPVALVALWYFLLRRRGPTTATRGERWAVFGARLVVVLSLLIAATGPYTVATVVTPGDPTVTMLEDQSASTAVSPDVADELAAGIEENGVSVDRRVVANGNHSSLGDTLVANLEENGSVLLLSDGRVTDGRSLLDAGTVANDLNATVNAVAPDPDRVERSVRVEGPRSTSVDVANRFTVSVDGVVPDSGASAAVVTVTLDGEEILRESVENASAEFTLSRNFTEVGEHRVTARLDSDDEYDVNDVYRKTVRVVPKPSVLYVSNGDYRLPEYLDRLYDVTTASTVPDDLEEYRSVVLQNVPAGSAGNLTALQRHVLDGKGLVVAGGEEAYDRGNYTGTRLESMTPVRVGESTEGTQSNVVIALDISDSSYEQLQIIKALGASALEDVSAESQVGVIAFDDGVYRVADLQPVEPNRDEIASRIRSLDNGLATRVDKALLGARDALGGRQGTVVLISDGRDRVEPAIESAERLQEAGGTVVSVGVGDPKEELLRGVAEATGGTYLTANQSGHLELIVGDTPDDGDEGGSGVAAPLTVLDRGHFVTEGVTLGAALPRSNVVDVKAGASYLASTGGGDPALTAWRYGPGRVVSLTAYAESGRLAGLLSRPDSLVLSRSVNWAIGTPDREAEAYADVPDTRLDRRTTAVYHGDQRPGVAGLSFARTDDGRYEATIRPGETGYRTLLDDEYAVNYRSEYDQFGRAPELDALVGSTGGQRFAPDGANAIADAVVEQNERLRDERTDWAWAFFVVGLVVYFGEVSTRRIRQFRGRGTIP